MTNYHVLKWLLLHLFFCWATVLYATSKEPLDEAGTGQQGFSLYDTFQAFGSQIDTILVTGNEITKAHVIRQEILFREGDTLSADLLRRSERQVLNLQLFNTVHISAKRFSPSDSEKDSVKSSPDTTLAAELGNRMAKSTGRPYNIVVISVLESWYVFPIPQFNLRGTSVTKWVRNPTISNINAGISFQDRNFSGHGDLMSASFGVGFDPFVGLSYSTPYVLGSNRTGFGISLEHRTLRNLAYVTDFESAPNYSQTFFSIGVSFSQRLSTFEMIGCSFDYNSISVAGRTHTTYPSSTISSDGKDRYLTAGIFYRYQQLDFILFPMEGFLLNTAVSQSGFSGSSNKIGFTRGSLDVRFYQKLIGNLAIGLRSYSLISSNNPIPNYLRQFIGFTTQIRGYTSSVLNGDNIQFNSAELRYPVIKLNTVRLNFIPIEKFSIFQYGLFVTAFLDGGTIWYNSHSPGPAGRLNRFKFSDYKYGYGAGLVFVASRWTARLDAAFNELGEMEFIFEKSVSF